MAELNSELPEKGAEISAFCNQIFYADALTLLRRLPDASVDCVLCDLPYGVTACAWDEIIPLAPMWEAIKRVVKPRGAIVLTATQPFTSKLVSSNYAMFKEELIWRKNGGGGFLNAKKRHMTQHENILIFSKGAVNYFPQMIERDKPITYRLYAKSKLFHMKTMSSELYTSEEKYPNTVLEFSNNNQNDKLHPTQKPVALFEYLIKTYTQAGDIVLDMCVGSGTTAIAARNLGRHFICGDSHQPYVEMARTRLQNSDPFQSTIFKDGTKQLSLFEGLE